MPFFKSKKIAPTPYVTSLKSIDETKPLSQANNFMFETAGRTNFYACYPGNIDVYTSGGFIKALAENFNAAASNSPVTEGPKGIPRENLFTNERAAFAAAKAKFDNHPFVILQLSLIKGDMKLMADNLNGKTVPVYNIDLLTHIQSVKGFKANTTEYTPEAGTVHKKVGATFQPEAAFESPVIKSRR
jgi:hypothetical protein